MVMPVGGGDDLFNTVPSAAMTASQPWLQSVDPEQTPDVPVQTVMEAWRLVASLLARASVVTNSFVCVEIWLLRMALVNEGVAMVSKIAKIAMVIMSSINVNPR